LGGKVIPFVASILEKKWLCNAVFRSFVWAEITARTNRGVKLPDRTGALAGKVFCQDLCKRITQLEKFEKSAAALHPLTRLPVAAASVASRRKLFPCRIVAPKFPAIVCPMSASVSRMPKFAPASNAGPSTRQNRDVLARMVGVWASVDRDQQPWSAVIISRSVRLSWGKKPASKRVEFFQSLGKAFYVFAVPVEHVEIDEVAEDESVFALANGGSQFLNAIGVALGGDIVRDTAAIVDVVDFANAKHRDAALLENIQQHRFWRIDGVIVTPRSASKITGWASKRPRDHASTRCGPSNNFRAISHMRYSSAIGITSSCAAI